MVRDRYGLENTVSCFDFRFKVDGDPNPSMALDYEPFLGDTQPEWALILDGQHAVSAAWLCGTVEPVLIAFQHFRCIAFVIIAFA